MLQLPTLRGMTPAVLILDSERVTSSPWLWYGSAHRSSELLCGTVSDHRAATSGKLQCLPAWRQSAVLCDQHATIMVAVTSFNLSFPCLKRNYWNKWRVIKERWENNEIKIRYYFVTQNSTTITVSFYGAVFFLNYIRKFLGWYAWSVSSVSARDRAQCTGVLHGMWLLPAHRSPAMWMTRIGHKPNDLRRCST